MKFFSGKINLKFINNFFLSITWEGLIPTLIELAVFTTNFPFLSIMSALNNFFEKEKEICIHQSKRNSGKKF